MEGGIGGDQDRHVRLAFDEARNFVGLGHADASCVTFEGADPVVPSRHRLGAASAAAIAAQALGIIEIWKTRTGREQRACVDVRNAAYPGLCTFLHIRQNGHPLPFTRWDGQGPNFFATKDDRRFYLLYTANYVQHCLDVHRFLGATTGHESVANAVAKWNSDELEQALAEARLFGCIARTQEEWRLHPQGRLLAARPPVLVTRINDAEPVPFAPGADRPLSGLRVVDMAHVLAGPITSRVLAEQGASVLHVSAPHQPDGHLIDVDTGFGKRTAFIDLDLPSDVERLRALIRDADVFIQSWRPGALARRGFSPSEVADLCPGVVYVSLSCYGDEGPWADRGGYEPLGQAVSGLAIDEGSPEEPRLAPTFTLNDYLTAYLAAAGVVAALLRRSKEGGSYHVSTSLTQSSMWVQSLGRLPQEMWPEGRLGIRDLPSVPESAFQETDSVFGVLRHPRPLVQYSETIAYWARPPMPMGASKPVWFD
ncbi:MAG TPA: CoA transferase [Zeimonas sp.]|nr:CoA transferase [Zeimonas sp.]